MDSREMYKAAEHLGSLVIWEKDWIHFGTGDGIKFDLLKKLFEDFFTGEDFLFIHGRTNSGEYKNEDFFSITEQFLGTENFEIWSVKMDKAIMFNKIGILLLGRKK
ncbi:hypothetical protein NK987_15695 [Aquiflexum sp. XJ19-10]|nr:hypothetical protein [Aquiflexum gelatinilyticum]